MKSRAAVVIIEDGFVALIRRVRETKTYYVFPGGGVEANESLHQAAQREALEELGVQVEVGPCLFHATGMLQEYYFSASITGGTFGAGTGEEFTEPERGRGSYEPVWMPLHLLREIQVYPEELGEKLYETMKLKISK